MSILYIIDTSKCWRHIASKKNFTLFVYRITCFDLLRSHLLYAFAINPEIEIEIDPCIRVEVLLR